MSESIADLSADIPKIGIAWGDEITDERARWLDERLAAWSTETDHGERIGPFDTTGLSAETHEYQRLTGADVFWLAEQSDHDEYDRVPNLHLERANLVGAHLEGANLSLAQMTEADLSGAQLTNSNLRGAQLTGAFLRRAKLTGAFLTSAHLTSAIMIEASLDGALLIQTHLMGADLSEAQLRGADLSRAQLTGAIFLKAQLTSASLRKARLTGALLIEAQLTNANLGEAQLASADLSEARLGGADLRNASFDSATALSGAILSTPSQRTTRLADIHWGGANLTVIAWEAPIAFGLGDEQAARKWKPVPFSANYVPRKLSRKERAAARQEWRNGQGAERRRTFQEAVRANRQLATALRDQGMNEQADQFAYRAQAVQRQVYRLQGNGGKVIFSWLLDLVAGYGYKPARSLYTYLGVLFGFAFLFFLAGNGWLTFGLGTSQYENLPWYEALILSVSSFHGRGFFQPLQTLGDPVAIIASVEAVFGLFIEVAFIATFTQRFFGK